MRCFDMDMGYLLEVAACALHRQPLLETLCAMTSYLILSMLAETTAQCPVPAPSLCQPSPC